MLYASKKNPASGSILGSQMENVAEEKMVVNQLLQHFQILTHTARLVMCQQVVIIASLSALYPRHVQLHSEVKDTLNT